MKIELKAMWTKNSPRLGSTFKNRWGVQIECDDFSYSPEWTGILLGWMEYALMHGRSHPRTYRISS